MTEVIKIITVMDTMTASGRLKLQGALERKKTHCIQMIIHYSSSVKRHFLAREQQKMSSLQSEYLGLSLWSSARTAPVESGSVVEVLGALMVVVSEG